VPLVEIDTIQVGNLQFTAPGRFKAGGDVGDLSVIEIEVR
jgi:hypothetical protein